MTAQLPAPPPTKPPDHPGQGPPGGVASHTLLASVADLETHLQKTLDQDQAELALAGASGAVRAYCGWRIDRTAETFVRDGDGSYLLALPTMYLHAVLNVWVGEEWLDPAAGSYSWSHYGVLWCSPAWPLGHRNITAETEHGYDVTPDAVRAVVLNLAGRQLSNPERLRSATVGTVTRAYSTEEHAKSGMTVLDQALLGPFRLPLRP